MSGGFFDQRFHRTILIRTKEQLQAVLSFDGERRFDRICLEQALLCTADGNLKETIKSIFNNGITIFAALSHMLREEEGRSGTEEIRRILDWEMISGALVRNLEEAAFLKEIGYPGIVEADQALAPWNRAALGELLELADEWTISPELNVHEIRELLGEADPIGEKARSGAELVVYGRTPMMVSAGCVRRTTGRCPGGRESTGYTEVLRDRKGMRIPVITDCRNCCNVIYNAVPLYLGRQADRIDALGIRRIRMDLTTENTEETLALLAGQPGETTAGRFLKGVE